MLAHFIIVEKRVFRSFVWSGMIWFGRVTSGNNCLPACVDYPVVGEEIFPFEFCIIVAVTADSLLV